MSLAGWIKSLIPRSIKDGINEARRRRRFRIAFDRYRQLSVTDDPPTELLQELVEAWANEGFSTLGEYISAFIRHARQTPGPIVECGSGLSTLLLGVEASRRGGKVWTLEHHPEWAQRMRSELHTWGIGSVELCQAPLRTYGEYAWYDPPLDRMPSDFSLVVCDGPPGDTLGGRYGMMPVLRSRLRSGCVILLDDFERADERTAAARWVQETGATLEEHPGAKPYALLRVP